MRCLLRRAPLAFPLLCLLLACARDPMLENGQWRSERSGFRIGEPPAVAGGETPWQRYRLEGAALAYRRGERETMSLQARCGRPQTSPAIMARHLVAGIRERTLREGGPREVAGQSAWLQAFDARVEGKTVRIKTLTVVTARCVYDLLFVAEGYFEPAERDFDAWVESFSLDAAYVAGAGE